MWILNYGFNRYISNIAYRNTKIRQARAEA